jgi:transcriptional regulator with XRE-family HTH domain
MVETNLAKQRSRFIATCPNSLAHIFRNLRIHRRMTTKEFSEKLGVGEIYITQIECGFKKASLKYWLMAGQEFGFNPNYIKVKWLNEKSNYFKERLKRKIGLIGLQEV